MKTSILTLMSLGLFLVSSSTWAATDCTNDSLYSEVDRKELSELVAKKAAFIVDVNSASSFKKNRVPGAVHFGSHRKEFAKMLPTDKNALIVAYCGGPMCSAWKQAAEEACAHGYTNIKHYKGGISGWTKGS